MPVYAVSAVRLDSDGRITAVEWGPVNASTHQWESAPRPASVAEVVKAIEAGDPVFSLFHTDSGLVPGLPFMAVEYDNGWKTINLDGPPTLDREVHGMQRMSETVSTVVEREGEAA